MFARAHKSTALMADGPAVAISAPTVADCAHGGRQRPTVTDSARTAEGQLKPAPSHPNRTAPTAVSDNARALRGHALAIQVRAAVTKVW